MLHRKAERNARGRWALAALVFVLLGCVFTQSALAASAPTPESATQCGGILKRDKPTALDPNLLNYSFTCDYGVTAYTLIINRQPNNDSTIDDFSSSVSVFDPTGNAVATESFTCSGTIPGVGVNCNAGAGGSMTGGDTAQGTFDTTDPYCPNIPKGSKAGTKPEPGAVVQLVVTDTTGAMDGPFRLRLGGKCPAVHVKKSKSKPKTGGKQSGGQQTADKATRS